MKTKMSLLTALYIAESALVYTISEVEKEQDKDASYHEHLAEKKDALAVLRSEIARVRENDYFPRGF